MGYIWGTNVGIALIWEGRYKYCSYYGLSICVMDELWSLNSTASQKEFNALSQFRLFPTYSYAKITGRERAAGTKMDPNYIRTRYMTKPVKGVVARTGKAKRYKL